MSGDNLEANLAVVAEVERVAADLGVTPAQVALAWVHAQGPDIVPIPGTKRRRYLEDNVAAASIHLTDEQRAQLAQAGSAVQGDRYPDMSPVHR